MAAYGIAEVVIYPFDQLVVRVLCSERGQGLGSPLWANCALVLGPQGDDLRKPPYLTASGDLSHHVDAFPPPYPVRPGPGGKMLAQSGTDWETLAGYSRAIRTGNRILVSGTTATHGNRLIGGDDPAAQTHAVIDKIEGAIQSLGGRLDHVVRTRIFVRDLADWEPVARAHGERFAGIQPANTLVRAELIGSEYRVEIEAEAVVGPEHP